MILTKNILKKNQESTLIIIINSNKIIMIIKLNQFNQEYILITIKITIITIYLNNNIPTNISKYLIILSKLFTLTNFFNSIASSKLITLNKLLLIISVFC
jgi:hypothetical protein